MDSLGRSPAPESMHARVQQSGGASDHAADIRQPPCAPEAVERRLLPRRRGRWVRAGGCGAPRDDCAGRGDGAAQRGDTDATPHRTPLRASLQPCSRNGQTWPKSIPAARWERRTRDPGMSSQPPAHAHQNHDICTSPYRLQDHTGARFHSAPQDHTLSVFHVHQWISAHCSVHDPHCPNLLLYSPIEAHEPATRRIRVALTQPRPC